METVSYRTVPIVLVSHHSISIHLWRHNTHADSSSYSNLTYVEIDKCARSYQIISIYGNITHRTLNLLHEIKHNSFSSPSRRIASLLSSSHLIKVHIPSYTGLISLSYLGITSNTYIIYDRISYISYISSSVFHCYRISPQIRSSRPLVLSPRGRFFYKYIGNFVTLVLAIS